MSSNNTTRLSIVILSMTAVLVMILYCNGHDDDATRFTHCCSRRH